MGKAGDRYYSQPQFLSAAKDQRADRSSFEERVSFSSQSQAAVRHRRQAEEQELETARQFACTPDRRERAQVSGAHLALSALSALLAQSPHQGRGRPSLGLGLPASLRAIKKTPCRPLPTG